MTEPKNSGVVSVQRAQAAPGSDKKDPWLSITGTTRGLSRDQYVRLMSAPRGSIFGD